MERNWHWFEREELPSHENRHAFLRSFFKWILGLVTATHSISILGFSEMGFYLFVFFFSYFLFFILFFLWMLQKFSLVYFVYTWLWPPWYDYNF